MAESDPLMLQLIASFQAGAMVQLGKVVHPLTGKIERDLDQARSTIDILTMLERKCKGNLSDEETKFLEHVLFELRMNYLDESERPVDRASGTDARADESGKESNGGVGSTPVHE